MTLERPPSLTQDDPERLNRWLNFLWAFVTTPVSGINETNHAALGNLNSTNYTHLTSTQATNLTNGGNATIHYHDSDRDRANHSGTQIASTISDFYVAVQNAKRLASYTVATLPAGIQGDQAIATDALAPAFLVAVAGGGAVVAPVFYNGAAWIVG